MNIWVIVLGSASVFFALQAIYWIVTFRRESRHSVLAQRLGSIDAVEEGLDDILRRTSEDEGIWASLPFYESLIHRLNEARELGGVAAFMVRVLIFVLGGFAGGVVLTGDPVFALIFGLGLGLLPYTFLLKKVRKRILRIEEQLPEALEVMCISLRAGHSLAQTIRLTASELQAPLGEELRQVAEEAELGRPIDEALLAMADRVRGARSVRTFVVAVLVLRQTGGNLVEVIESIIDSMRQATAYQQKLQSMTAESRSSAFILAMLPPAFGVLSFLADPTYTKRLYTDSVGQMLVLTAGGFYLSGVIWVRRLVSPK
ncbi:type II secretion system F family protein [Myxococcota bacterium]|nr:type II secretion system F family protein [Myxococcota bacterium]